LPTGAGESVGRLLRVAIRRLLLTGVRTK
jgi:hypothetical protein